jgi:hypothetical protein
MGFFQKVFGSKPQTEKAKANANEPPPGKTMHTLDPKLVVEPFGKINYWDLPDGGKRIRAYCLLENSIEGAQTGVAIDGSGSMQVNFGKGGIRQVRQLTNQEWVSLIRMGLARQSGNTVEIINLSDPRTLATLVSFGVLQQIPPGPNIVEEQARKMTEYLSKFDADGGTTVIYWAAGDGRQVEVVGDLTGPQCPTAIFPGPQDFGSETHLLPAIKYFVERFVDAKWGMYVFITDGCLNDLDAVKRYCTQLARDIAKGKRNDLKFVLIGVGDDIDEDQMEELDDLETGTNVDLWDHKIAKEMKQLADIFAEVVSATVIIVPGDGVVKDTGGNIVKNYRDTGLPALMWFDLPPGSQWFALEVGGQVVAQPLAAGVNVPVARPVSPPAPAAPPATVPCIECREPLPVGTKTCPRCGVSQEAPVQKLPPQPAPPPSPAQPLPPTPAAGPAQLVADPQALDFGSVTHWKGDLPTQEVRLRNRGGGPWSGTVRSTLPWLEVSPATVSCPAGSEVVLTIRLTPAGSKLKPKAYNVPDAIFVEGEGQALQVSVQMDAKG